MRFVSLLAVAAVCSLASAPALANLPSKAVPAKLPVALAAGTPVNIHLVKPLSSGDANAGDTFEIAASDDVAVGGVVVIRKDAAGQGTVLGVDRAGSHGHSGTLALGYSWISGVDGSKIALTNTTPATTTGGAGGAGAAQLATTGASIAGALAPQALGAAASFAGPLVSVASAFMRGKNVTVDPARSLSAFVAAPAQVVVK